ncbi:MAG: hypothetical protein AAF741_17285 [Bacteroidota bacterium]
MKYLSILLLFVSLSVQAQDSFDEQILAAYISNDGEAWGEVLEKMAANTNTQADQLKLGHAAYTAIGTAFSLKDQEMAERYMSMSMLALDKVLEADKKHASANGLMSGVLGMSIALDPSKAMQAGMASSRHAQKALRFGEEDPVALTAAASNLIYTPKEWGGDIDKGLELIQKAVSLFEAGDSPEEDWRYYETLTILGEGLKTDGQKEAARAVYLKALALQPEFSYVKYYLLPQLDQE